jgi:hypothetical protein
MDAERGQSQRSCDLRNGGALSFGYLSLGKQRKVTPTEGATPPPGKPKFQTQKLPRKTVHHTKRVALLVILKRKEK